MSAEHAELLPRYKHLREVAFQLNNRLVKTLPKSVLDEGGKKLGILKKNVLVLDTEDEVAVLADYCIHDVRRQGLNAVERYLAESPPPPDSDERVLLQAMRQARYSLFVVEAVERGVGVHVHDLLRDEPLFLVDVGFSQTAPIGAVLAARVVAHEGMVQTTGAGLPLGVLSPEKRTQFLEVLRKVFPHTDFRNLSPEQASEMSAKIIRMCRECGAAEHIVYQEPEHWSAVSRGSAPSLPPPPARRVGRNDRCPCGSGKKFKHCCGGRR
ncbi:MAG TPA: SEC-C metal-binding domain-containing protein [Gemmataceae bacterium]|nr:SEC-C metal-binding domain-containing protein [Gemmataceae bacterium]